MRKAAYIIGCICVALSLAGGLMKLTSIPGGGLLLILFSSFFSVAALPLYVYSIRKAETSRLMSFAVVLGAFAFADTQIGLLFYAQRWPDPMAFIRVGCVGLIVFLVLYVLASRKPETKTRGISAFVILPVIIMLSLGLGCYAAYGKMKSVDDKMVMYKKEISEYERIRSQTDSLIKVFHADTSNKGIDSSASLFFIRANDVIVWIENAKTSFLSELNNGYTRSLQPEDYGMSRPENTDVSTYYMVGADVIHPTGKGMELYDVISSFRKSKLHSGVTFAIPVQDGMEYKEQWVKDNFYHVTAVELMMRLTIIQKNIYQSMQESIHKKLFIK